MTEQRPRQDEDGDSISRSIIDVATSRYIHRVLAGEFFRAKVRARKIYTGWSDEGADVRGEINNI